MSLIKRTSVALMAVIGLVFALLLFPTGANAAPYVNGLTCSVGTTSPTPGGSLSLACDDSAGDTLDVTLHTQTYDLGKVVVPASGVVNLSLNLPAGISGSHTLIITDERTGQSQSIALTIGGSSSSGSGSGSSNSSPGNLSSTGVAVIGIGTLGLVLLAGGALMLLAGRRRSKVDVNA